MPVEQCWSTAQHKPQPSLPVQQKNSHKQKESLTTNMLRALPCLKDNNHLYNNQRCCGLKARARLTSALGRELEFPLRPSILLHIHFFPALTDKWVPRAMLESLTGQLVNGRG